MLNKVIVEDVIGDIFDICDVKTEMRRGHLFKMGQILIQGQKARALDWVSRPWFCWFGAFWLNCTL